MLAQDYSDWKATEETKNARKEIEELYAWWQEWKKKETSERPSTFKKDHEEYLKEDEMLKRLTDVRMYMWTRGKY